MTQILNVTRNDDGQYEITNAAGKVVEIRSIPMPPHGRRWTGSIHRARCQRQSQARESFGASLRPRIGARRPVARRVSSRSGKEAPDEAERSQGARLGSWCGCCQVRSTGERKFRDHKLGTFGAASDVKRIDPALYLAEKSARGEA